MTYTIKELLIIGINFAYKRKDELVTLQEFDEAEKWQSIERNLRQQYKDLANDL